MKKNEFIKKAIDENIADKEGILYNTLNSYSESEVQGKDRFRPRKMALRSGISFAVIMIMVSICIFDGFPIGGQGQPSQGNQIAKVVKTHKQLQKNIFTLAAYAEENSNPNGKATINEESKTILKPNMKVQMPFGKIEKGEPYKTVISGIKYGTTFKGGCFECTGDNIELVTITSQTGRLQYFDVDMLKEMEAKGELYICRIPLPKEKIDPPWGFEKVKKVFYQMWSSGELDEYKNKYFGGKNINLDDYSISINERSEQGERKVFLVIADKVDGGPRYAKEGKTLEVKAGSKVSWGPEKAMEVLSTTDSVKYEELPGDTVTVTVKFIGGEIATQTVYLSFDKEGNVIGEIK